MWIHHPDTQTVTSPGFCLDVAGNATANFSKLEIWDCIPNGGAQMFQLRSDGSVYNPQSGRCLDVNQGTHDVATLQLYDCIGGDAQRFTLN
ncbi:RICIN domain-containing protein [Luteipulveratus sp. YIM 133132]|uniref:RICIN domain-containing protein n=1 Tax=Luteipulveratus flavus TaxID=3031728 RepID=UPI0023AFC2D7|nr:RICIN domain-containing protein [Luteipulveratus sp. YIM 133132]MDE9366580.1 RICIN domain-containing protein [Luteipulveratus sp. YIM 133132]